ncbi:interleukin 21 receptor, tandem duplicate 2 isoform X1 [Clarias gariepinus]|uniref:interleukin 21 receptor, tandem duplicate 2 isoform X1 n=1 Tax=Clarias gariepinus TaxID=13013 RepID=UPI00234D33CE|nr:interleukin 21 receptor, tandem duplicate 2 isoform X1 [Clarias gariepinus]
MGLQLGLLCALLIFTQICQAKEQALVSSDLLVCDTDYWLNISCFLDSRAIPKRKENITYQLEFNMKNDNINFCSLAVEKDGYSCIFRAKVAAHRSSFTDNHEFKISLCELKQCVLLKSSYKPAHHIKPITPYNLTVQYENGNYTFTWNSGYETHIYGKILPFEYILRYQQVGQSIRKELHTKQTKYMIPETHFTPGTEYIATVYNKILSKNAQYDGTTSHESTEIRWRTRPVLLQGSTVDAGRDAVSVESGIIIPICLVVGLMSLLLFPVARMKIKKIAWVKTPAPHISPLTQTAQCNIQLWLSKGHVQQVYSEEISTIDMITEITARQQLPEHTTNMYSQCHTPYVGPSPEFWAPCLTSDTCITDTNPCTNLDFLPDDCDVQENLLCLSKLEAVESFMSLDDLEPKLEICKPTEVLTFTNPAQNYCTLTNSDIGLIPTFGSVQCVPNLGLRLNDHSAPNLLNMTLEENTPELDTVTLDNLQLSIEG